MATKFGLYSRNVCMYCTGRRHISEAVVKSEVSVSSDSIPGYISRHISFVSWPDKSNTSIAEETDRLRKETIHLKHEFRAERDKLKQLSDKYKESKKYNPTQRYPLLKDMIKQVSRT